MKKSLFVGFICIALVCGQSVAGNYVLTVEGEKHEVDVGEQTIIKLSDGKTIQVTLEKKAVASFSVENFSFDHPGDVAPSRTDLGNGVHQTMMTTPLGTLAIVQEYTNMNPSDLVDVMLNELTKEEKEYGYAITNSSEKMKLANGKMLSGKKSIATYRGEQIIRHVLCYSLRDAGIIVITQMAKDASPIDKAMIDTFWESFNITIK
jgi:hypothetical protein